MIIYSHRGRRNRHQVVASSVGTLMYALLGYRSFGHWPTGPEGLFEAVGNSMACTVDTYHDGGTSARE